MRRIQIGMFILALASFVASAFFVGQPMGDTLWRVGVAASLLDIVHIQLWGNMNDKR